jgi:pyruvyltransferase
MKQKYILLLIIFIILILAYKYYIYDRFFSKNIENFKKLEFNNLNFKLNYGKGNFGDSVNKVFWSKMTEKNIIDNNKSKHYLTTGSIMELCNDNSVIFGTGFISNNSDLGGTLFKSNTNKKKASPTVISVRGPKTRNKLLDMNINCPANYGDPLILFPCIYNKKKIIKNSKLIIGIIPHYVDFNNKNVNTLIRNLNNNNYNTKKINILVGEDYEDFLSKINDCDVIISSSLHGVIMGIVYNKKTIFIEFSKKVRGNKFKFNDFFESIDIKYKVKNTYDVTILNNVIKVNYSKLNATALKLLKICPFISDERKKILIKKYKNFYNL